MSEKLTAGTYRATFKLTKSQNTLADVTTVIVDVYLTAVPKPMTRKDAIGQILYLMEWPGKYADRLVSFERLDE